MLEWSTNQDWNFKNHVIQLRPSGIRIRSMNYIPTITLCTTATPILPFIPYPPQGALDKNGNLQDRVNFTAYYVASASARGITCVWWDNHAFSGDGERFGLIRRNTLEWVYPDIALAIEANCLINR